MSKHTPGPWKVVQPDAINPSRAMVCADKGVDIYCAPLTNETLANARLIASAPDLLDLLKQAVHACEDNDEVWLGSAFVKAARAAIAKAGGRDE